MTFVVCPACGQHHPDGLLEHRTLEGKWCRMSDEQLAELESAFGNYTSGSGFVARIAALEIRRLRALTVRQNKISELDYHFAMQAYAKLREVVPDDPKFDDHPLASVVEDVTSYLRGMFDGQDWKAVRYHDSLIKKAEERAEKAKSELKWANLLIGCGVGEGTPCRRKTAECANECMTCTSRQSDHTIDELRAALQQAALDLGNHAALWTMEGKADVAQITKQQEEQARAALKRRDELCEEMIPGTATGECVAKRCVLPASHKGPHSRT